MAKARELPPARRFIEGASLAAANAVRLVRAAKLLRLGGYKGPAVVLLVTAIEEATKGAVLAYLSEDTGEGDERTAALGRVLGDHRTRLSLAIWASGEPRSPQARSPRSEPEGAESPTLGLIFLAALVLLAVYLSQPGISSRRDGARQAECAVPSLGEIVEEQSDAAEELAARAFLLRNRGFYVDYAGDNWMSPAEVTAAEEREIRALALPIVRAMTLWSREIGRK